MTDKETQIYDVKDVLKILGISRATLYSLINSGELKSIMISRRRRKITRKALTDFIEKRESDAA